MHVTRLRVSEFREKKWESLLANFS